MKVKLESDGSSKDFDILRELHSGSSDKCVLLKPAHQKAFITNYVIESIYGHRPESTLEFYSDAELVNSPKDKASEIVRLFESLTDAGDIQFLKRYFEIKLAAK